MKQQRKKDEDRGRGSGRPQGPGRGSWIVLWKILRAESPHHQRASKDPRLMDLNRKACKLPSKG